MISPRLKVEDSYPLTVVVEDEKDNPSVGRTIYMTVQTLQVLSSDPDTSGQINFPGENISLLLF